MNKNIIFTLGLIALLSGCIFSSDDKKKVDNKEDPKVSQRVFVLASDYQTGELLWLNDNADSLVDKGILVHQDSKLKGRGDMLMVLESFGKDNLLRLDAKKPGKSSIKYQVSLPENSNPLDMVFPANDTAHGFLAQGNLPHLLKIDLSTGKAVDSLDLSEYNDPSSEHPNMQNLLISGDSLFITLERRKSDFSNELNGLLVIVDALKLTVLDTVNLGLFNPSSMVSFDNNIYVSCTGVLPWDGSPVPGDSTHGVVIVDRKTKEVSTLAYDKQLGGSPMHITFDEKNARLFITAFNSFGNAGVVYMSIKGGKVKQIDGIEDFFGGLVFDNKNQKLYIGDRGMNNPGVKVFANDKLTTLASGGAMPPYSIHIANW